MVRLVLLRCVGVLRAGVFAVVGLAACGADRFEPPVLCGGHSPPCVDVRIVAHPDDDLLFMNPDIAASIAAGNRVVTVFATAGTSVDPARLAERERGILNAYAFMIEPSFAVASRDDAAAMLAHWQLSGGAPIQLRVPGVTHQAIEYDFDASAQVSIVFLRIVEQSGVDLPQLSLGNVPEVSTVACAAGCVLGSALPRQPYTEEQVIDALEAVLDRFDDGAADLAVSTLDATQLYHREEAYGLGWVDHGDHLATAALAVSAFIRHRRRSRTSRRTLHQYRTYNTGREEPNLAGADLAKRRAFYRYYVLGEPLSGLDDTGHLIEYTNRDPDDPYFWHAPYDEWSRRRYVLSSLPPGSGRLTVGTSDQCLDVSGDTLVLTACNGAPRWDLTPDDSLVPSADPASCVALDANGTARLSPCASIDDAERRTFVLTETGQIRTRLASCLHGDADGIRAAHCEKLFDDAGDPLRRPIEAQHWGWR